MLQAFILLLTGFAGLVYEVVWTRWFATVYGGTVPAGAAVLCAYLGGLALGSAWLGRRVDRSESPNRMLGMLQVLVGLLGLASLTIPELLPDFYAALMAAGRSPLTAGIVRFLLAGVLLLLPAVLMGGVLPAALRWAHAGREGSAASLAGWLRGANCLGATLGAAVAVVVLIPRIGLSGAVLAGVAANFLAAGLAMGRRAAGTAVISPSTPDFRAVFPPADAKHKKRDKKGSKKEGSEEDVRNLPLIAAVALAVLVGAVTLCTELAQVRAIAFFTSSTLKSFAAVTATYIACLGIGALIGAPLAGWTGRKRAPGALAVCLALAGAGAGLSAWLLALLGPGGSTVAVAIVGCAPSALPLGAVFPLLVSLLDASRERVGRAAGLAGAALDLGSTAGPLLAALLLLPLAGTRFTLMILGSVSVLAAVVLSFWAGRAGARPWLASRLLIVVALPIAVLPPLYCDLYGAAVVGQIRREARLEARMESMDEGVEAVISVVSVYRPEEGRDVRALYIGRRMQADDSTPWLRIEKMIGVLPALLCPISEGRSFHLGLGSGVSAAWSAAAGPGRKADVAEIVPGVAEKLGEFARHNSVGQYNVRLGDGRSMLAADEGGLSLVVTDIVFPEDAGAGGLFSLEYFRLVESKLADGGLFAQWLPLWQLSPEGFKSSVAAFRRVFPEATMWAVSVDAGRPLVAVIGIKGKSKKAFDPEAIEARIRAAKLTERQLAGLNLGNAEAVLSHFVAGGERVKELVEKVSPLSDNLPLTELAAPAPPDAPWSLVNLNSVRGIWEQIAKSEALGSREWEEKIRTRASELGRTRLALADANLSLYRQGPEEALVRLRDARDRNRLDPEAAYALWALLWGVAEGMTAANQMAPKRGLYDEALRVWDPLKDKVDFDPRRDFILRGMAHAGLALSSGPGGITSRKGMADALKDARIATELDAREAANWRVRARIAERLGLTEEAEIAGKRVKELEDGD